MPVADLDGAAQHPPERALLGCGDDPVGAVEDERLHLAASEVGDDQAGVDDDAGGQFTQLVDGGFTGEDAQQRFGAAPVDGGGVGADRHLDQGGGHPFTHRADHPVALILAVQVAFDPPQRLADGGPGDRVELEVTGDGAVEPGVQTQRGRFGWRCPVAVQFGVGPLTPVLRTALTACPKVSSPHWATNSSSSRANNSPRPPPAASASRSTWSAPISPPVHASAVTGIAGERHGRGGGSVWRYPADRLVVRDSRAHGARDPSERHTPERSQRAARRASSASRRCLARTRATSSVSCSPSFNVSRSTVATLLQRCRGVLRRSFPSPHHIEHTF